MKITGYKKNRIVLAIIGVISIILISFISVKFVLPLLKSPEKEVNSDLSVTVDFKKELQEKYEDEGVDLSDSDRKKKESKRISRELNPEELGEIPEDSEQMSRYKKYEDLSKELEAQAQMIASRKSVLDDDSMPSSQKELSKMIEEGKDISELEDQYSNYFSEDDEEESLIGDGSVTEEELEEFQKQLEEENKKKNKEELEMAPLNQLIAASRMEVQNTMGIIRDAINRSIKQDDEYNSMLLAGTLSSKKDGRLNEKTNIDNMSYGQFLEVVRNWLFYNSESLFSWKMVSQSKDLYASIVDNSLYEKNFSNIKNEEVQLLDQFISLDGRDASYIMLFSDGGAVYKGYFSIDDSMPRLLDLQVIK